MDEGATSTTKEISSSSEPEQPQQQRPGVPEHCQVILLSPLDIQFSQTRIRPEFQDSRLLCESLTDIEVTPLVPGAASADVEATPQEDDDGSPLQLLRPPFPRIEVTRWRCKLRAADGSARIDPVTGLELYAEQERWFSFDNRRLYCLQKAAVKSWPSKVRCEVVVVPQAMAKFRELRKFDTRTCGWNVSCGRRDEPNPELWSWRSAAGLPEEEPEVGVAKSRSGARFRGRGKGGGKGYRREEQEEEPQEGQSTSEMFRNVLLFFLVYIGLRIVWMTIKRSMESG